MMSNVVGAAISVRGLTVIRGGRAAVDGLDLDVAEGTVTGLLGPSGSGKSTLLRSIVGVQRIESGQVSVLGQPAGDAGLRSRVGYMTQSLSVYRDLTVRENLNYFGRLIGGEDQVDHVLEMVTLGDFADRPVERLSGGQQARVSLATAMLGSPDVLVLDEPTVGLDPLLRRSLWELFHRLAHHGKTLLVSSHVMDEAAHCDELLLLRDGKLLAQDGPEALLVRTGQPDLESAFISLIGDDA